VTVTVCVPHVNTPHYAAGCVAAIFRQSHPDIEVDVIVVDQSDPDEKRLVKQMLGVWPGVRVIDAERVDAGWPIDVAAKLAEGEYFCSLDCDAFPIHPDWLARPVRLIRDHGADWVGSDTGLAAAYTSKGISEPYVHLNNYFRVSRTESVQAASAAVGFLRWGNHYKVNYEPLDSSWPEMPCDNGVKAQWWASQRGESKLSLGISSALGVTPKMGIYGMVIEGLVFHLVFGWGEEWIEDLQDTLGDDYLELSERMREEGVTDGLLKEMLSRCVPEHGSPRRHLDGEPLPETLLGPVTGP
jgi:glycosyltransferase involved in cell wall biosynthesis